MTDIVTTDGGTTAAMMLALSAANGGYGRQNGFEGHGWDGYRTEQNQANMSLMQSIGTVDKDVLAGTAAMEASQAAQSASLVSQLNNTTASLAARIDSTKEIVNSSAMIAAQQLASVDKDIMESRYLTLQNIGLDGDKTRAIIQSQYVDTLNRQLQTAQFQGQFDRLYAELANANQNIRATNQAINFGSGALTANPTNTNTNNHA